MVNTPVRIGVTGTHSTGKTVLLRRVEMELRAQGVTVARTGGLAKRAAALGLPKMEHHTAASTEWIMAQTIADEIRLAAAGARVILADRAVIDALAYYTAALEYRDEPSDTADVKRLTLLAAQAAKYDLLLATVPDPAVPPVAGHGYDARYRALVDTHVHRHLADTGTRHVRVPGTPHRQDAAIRVAVRLALSAVPA
ncbi:AAA domain-containing protein [Actinacidiphila alni]|uniref:AAA domain-containing protein n=1 Tax=Actinacidiphila alni TaxID=380248 RepID=A0A1I2L816_9ACTN|nr:AAA family ATPase [Actinacidiphila alni]SFF75345.1 AAA domain-containing protein [Actinacidiphila alni]